MLVDAPLVPGARVAVPEATARHLLRVLRLRAGDAVTVFDGRGSEHAARIERAARGAVEIGVGEALETVPEPTLAIDLAQGISRGERMDLVVQKAVELGVRSITPLGSARSVVRLDGERAASRLAHWRAVAAGACEQCGRATVPEIRPIRDLGDWLGDGLGDGRGEDAATFARLMLDPQAAHGPGALAAPADGVTLLVGPEGGLEPAETRAARAAGFEPVRLGPRVLRTETAAIVAITAVQLLWGDLDAAGPSAD